MNRKIIYIVGGVVAVLLLGLVILPFVVNVNQFRPQIEAAADSALNRKVMIGNIRLSVLSGGVSVEDISVSDDPAFGNGPFLTAKSVNVSVELMPLIFSRALHVTGLTINEPKVTLIRSSSGTWNFSALGAAEQFGRRKIAARERPQRKAAPTVSERERRFGRFGATPGASPTGKFWSEMSARPQEREYDGVNLQASDLSYTTQFPFQLTAKTPGTEASS